jgi:hypothetical protein
MEGPNQMPCRSPAEVSSKSRWLPPGTKITWLVTHFVLDSENNATPVTRHIATLAMASADQSGYWAICDMIAKYRQSVTY